MPAGLKLAEAAVKLLKGETVAGPAKLFLGLATEEQAHNTTSGSVKGELTYAGYARVEIVLANEELVAATEGAAEKILNSTALALNVNTNTTGTNKSKNWFLSSVASGAGDIWVYGSLAEMVEIVKAMTEVKIPAKELSIGVE